jgi:hypothetical protein
VNPIYVSKLKTGAVILLVAGVVGAASSQPTGDKSPTFKAPKGWKPIEPGPIALARFEIGEKDELTTVAVVGLTGDGGGLVANINRWRAQLKLEPLADKDAMQSLKAIKVNGIDAHLWDTTADKAGQRIVAVILPREKQTWYIRMTGPTKMVADQKAAFDAFVKSVRFEK